MSSTISNDTSVIQHIPNEQHPYRVPLFKLKSTPIHFSDTITKKAQTLRLKTCDFVSNYYNIGYNNNCLRWIRVVEGNDETNSNGNDNNGDKTSLTNPYFLSYKSNLIDVHLCKLYITPGIYASIDEIISEINSKFRESIVNLFGISTVIDTVYTNQSLINNPPPLTANDGTLIINNTSSTNLQLRNTKIPSHDIVKSKQTQSPLNVIYYLFNSLITTSNDETIFVNNGIVKFDGVGVVDSVDITESKIINPCFSDNLFNCSNVNNEINVNGSLSYTNDSTNLFVNGKIKNYKSNNSVALNVTDTNTGTYYYHVKEIKTGKLQSWTERFDFYNQTSTTTTFDVDLRGSYPARITITDMDDEITIDQDNNSVTHVVTPKYMTVEIDSLNVVAVFDRNNIPKDDISEDKLPVFTFTADITNGRHRSTTKPIEWLIIHLYNSFTYHDDPNWHYGCKLTPHYVNDKKVPEMFDIDFYNISGNGEKMNMTSDISVDHSHYVIIDEPQEFLLLDSKYIEANFQGDYLDFSKMYHPDNYYGVFKTDMLHKMERFTPFTTLEKHGYIYKYSYFVNHDLIINNSTVKNGILNEFNASTIPKSLFELNAQQSTTKPYRTITKNSSLYNNDSYYTSIVDSIIGETDENPFVAVSRLSDIFSNKVYLKWAFPLIPVTSDTIYSNTSNFIDIVQDPNFQDKYTTQFLPKVAVFDGSNYSLTEDNYKLNYYSNQDKMVDSYYYNFAVDENDLWKKLGYNVCKYVHSKDTIIDFKATNNPDDADIETELNHTYLIKGVYYSETNYHGPITLQHKTKVEESTAYTMKEISLPAGFNIWSLYANQDENNVKIFRTYFYKTTHLADQMLNLSIPKTIEIKITQNKDVEEYLNSNKIVDSIANIGTYEVVRDNQPSINAIQQQMVINQTIDIPPNDELYVFLTNGDHIYSLMDTAATLNIEYIN